MTLSEKERILYEHRVTDIIEDEKYKEMFKGMVILQYPEPIRVDPDKIISMTFTLSSSMEDAMDVIIEYPGYPYYKGMGNHHERLKNPLYVELLEKVYQEWEEERLEYIEEILKKNTKLRKD